MTKDTAAFPVLVRIWIFAVLGLFCFGTAGCSAVKAITTDEKEAKQLFKSRDQYVRIVKQDVAKGMKVPPNEHPVSLDSDQIRNVLSSLEISLPKQDKSVPVFNKPELDTLSRYLSQGLAEAGPDEDVIFAVIGDYRAIYGLAKEQKYTSGRVFYREGKLNIIFGKIQEDYKSYGMYAPVDRRLYPLSPGSRSVRSEHVWTLLPQLDQSFFESNDGLRTEWVILDLASMEARAAMDEKAAASSGSGAGGGQGQAVLKTEKTVEERLKVLTELKNKNLISEEEYQKKRADILKDL
jgi:hypothetical protein